LDLDTGNEITSYQHYFLCPYRHLDPYPFTNPQQFEGLRNFVYNCPMILDILDASEPSLRQKSKAVKKIDKKVKKLIKDMKKTLVIQDDPEGIGLAAPQVGKNLKIFIMKPDKKITTVINPKVLKVYRTRKKKRKDHKIMEGCLSLPHYYSPIGRAKKVKISYLDEKGKKIVKTFDGLEAQIVLHEVDHLNGVLFVDRSLEQKKKLYEYQGGEWEEVEL
jgi:peptide deformylase